MFANPKFQAILGSILGGLFILTLAAGHIGGLSSLLGTLGIYLNPDATPSSSPAIPPVAEPLKTKVTAMVTRGDTMVSPSVSPRMSPLSPSVSPLSPSSLPENNAIAQTPLPGTPAISQSATPLLTPSPSVNPTPASQRAETVVINEIAWMGTQASPDDEWFELYNPGAGQVSLTGWHLAAADGSPNIALSGFIAPGGYYLVERTDDTTIADIHADLTASFGHGLSNTGEDLALTDAHGAVQDRVDASAGWFAGDNTARISMERISPSVSGSQKSNWANNKASSRAGHDAKGNPINGSPRSANSASL